MSKDRKCIPPFLFSLICRLMDEAGADCDALVDGLEIEASDLGHQDTRVSFSDALVMIDNAYRLSGDKQLGLTVAREVNIADWGMMGYAVASCSNLWESLLIGQRYSAAATRLTDNTVESDEESFSLRSTPLYAAGQAERFLVEEDLGGVVGMLHRYLGDLARPREVHFTYAAPDYLAAYQRHFACPLKYGQPDNRIIWDAADMERPMPLRNPAATEMAIRHCEALIAEDRDTGNMIDRVRNRLISEPGSYPSLTRVAADFSMSESTLRRALRALGTSYQQILNDLRMKLAIEYLTTSSLRLEEISSLLGYSDLSNFRRAFRGWTGHPPLYYRRRRHAGRPAEELAGANRGGGLSAS